MLAVFLAASCKDKQPTPPTPMPNITGTWKGSGTKSGIPYTVTMNLTQSVNDTSIIGNGNIAVPLTTIPFSVTGANNYPDVELMFVNPSPNFGTGTYAGRFDPSDDNTINGLATVPAFNISNEPLRIKRTQ